MVQVVFDHVTKRFGSVTAVNDLSIEIRDREFLVLVGPSGCGKTTALRMVAGLEEVTAGNIFIGDRLVNDVSPKDRDIAMVFRKLPSSAGSGSFQPTLTEVHAHWYDQPTIVSAGG